ncbi:hypothetical protein D3C80_1448980 [compost metagenome]
MIFGKCETSQAAKNESDYCRSGSQQKAVPGNNAEFTVNKQLREVFPMKYLGHPHRRIYENFANILERGAEQPK